MSQSTENATDTEPKVTEENSKADEVIIEDKWLIRDCSLYEDEYDECTSFRGRFHQYFIYGRTLDCNQWKRDHDNCCKWVNKKDVKAAEAVINSEKARRMERLRAHYRNDTWKKRDAPPEDWAKPLPEWMVKRDENTLLAIKAKEIREGKDEKVEKSFCSIM
ncbi:synaptic plasticity regulator PANTS [Ostrinia nubilalis]|uniref:UPF0545 protein C22orf39 homolog n=1 Tax=Ostrinia furnacalis TaxID=93504 RepID=UPI00103B0DFB|nr:UPF0545 protein C22orf39 homolog [Ostrinia furnacalis]